MKDLKTIRGMPDLYDEDVERISIVENICLETFKSFNFQYFTSTYTTQAGKTYYFIYNQGYLPLENEEFYALVKRN